MTDFHLGSSKSLAKVKNISKWSLRTIDQPQHPIPEEEEEMDDPFVEAVWTPADDFK